MVSAVLTVKLVWLTLLDVGKGTNKGALDAAQLLFNLRPFFWSKYPRPVFGAFFLENVLHTERMV